MSVDVDSGRVEPASSTTDGSGPTRAPDSGIRRFAAFHNPTFLRFWMAITLALAGLWVRITVQGYLIYDLSHDKFLLGLAGFLSALPVLLLSPIVGVVVDRFERKRILLATQSFMALCLFTLATLDAVGVLTVTHILIIASLAGGASAFDWPARLSLVPNLVTQDELPSAVALNSAAFNGARWATLPRDIGALKTASLFDAKFAANNTLVLSNEGHGLSPAILPALTGGLRIPMAAGVESLNVATAGAIVLYAIFGQQLSAQSAIPYGQNR